MLVFGLNLWYIDIIYRSKSAIRYPPHDHATHLGGRGYLKPAWSCHLRIPLWSGQEAAGLTSTERTGDLPRGNSQKTSLDLVFLCVCTTGNWIYETTLNNITDDCIFCKWRANKHVYRFNPDDAAPQGSATKCYVRVARKYRQSRRKRKANRRIEQREYLNRIKAKQSKAKSIALSCLFLFKSKAKQQ